MRHKVPCQGKEKIWGGYDENKTDKQWEGVGRKKGKMKRRKKYSNAEGRDPYQPGGKRNNIIGLSNP